MKNLLEYLVSNIVNHPDKVTIKKEEENGTVVFRLETDPEDLGKTIGKKGKTIKAIRTLLNLKGSLKGVKARLYLEEQAPKNSKS